MQELPVDEVHTCHVTWVWVPPFMRQASLRKAIGRQTSLVSSVCADMGICVCGVLLQVCASAPEQADRAKSETMLQWGTAQTILALTASQSQLRKQGSGVTGTDNLDLRQLMPGLHRATNTTLHGVAQGAT
jgi:hypothetical protein